MLQRLMRLLLSGLLLLVLAVGLLRSSRGDRAQPEPGRQSLPRAQSGDRPDRERAATLELRPLLLPWLLLLLLGGAEFAGSFLPLGRSLRPLVMIPGVLMVAVVAVSFMEVGKGPTIVRGFAVAAMFWLIVLLGLGSADPLTRTDYHVPHARVD